MAWATATASAEREACSPVVRGEVGRAGSAGTESGSTEPPSGADGEPRSGGAAESDGADGAGIGSGIVAGDARHGGDQQRGGSSPSAQFGLSSTAVVPRRNITSVDRSSGTGPVARRRAAARRCARCG
jgi:hypothetical protein